VAEETEQMISRIMVSLDGSDRSRAILPYAVDSAARWNASVTLLRVVTPDRWDAEAPLAEAHLARIGELFRDFGLPVEAMVRRGSPREEILKVAFEVGADIIVLATQAP
jgi:nucleotide-binding universal stress UspA family protein